MAKYPTVYMVDEAQHATGEVLHFCTDICLLAYLNDRKQHDIPFVVGADSHAEIQSGEVCARCATALDPTDTDAREAQRWLQGED